MKTQQTYRTQFETSTPVVAQREFSDSSPDQAYEQSQYSLNQIGLNRDGVVQRTVRHHDGTKWHQGAGSSTDTDIYDHPNIAHPHGSLGDEYDQNTNHNHSLSNFALQRKAVNKPNNTGLPDNLKSGIESLSGMSMDHVKVHYNSSKPAQLQAHAYAQGNHIHVASGQEKHLPHEAWHVVQQRQGRVKPNLRLGNVGINDNLGLEREADVMGAKAERANEHTKEVAVTLDAMHSPLYQMGLQPIQCARRSGKQSNVERNRRERQRQNQQRRAERRGQKHPKKRGKNNLKRRRKRNHKKPDNSHEFLPLEHVLPAISEKDRATYAKLAEKDSASWGISGNALMISREGEESPFDEDFGDTGTIMWRADTRAPSKVLKTGFSTKAERDLGAKKDTNGNPTGNEIVYRTGTEDIVPATGVCVARDIRGASFFPFNAEEHDAATGKDGAYMYGIRVKKAVSTFKAQQQAEKSQTKNPDWHDKERFHYDPTEQHDDEASAVWPFAEYAMHRIDPKDIVGAYHFSRDRLVNPQTPGEEPKPGMGFTITPKNLISGKKRIHHPQVLVDEANETALAHSQRYPRHPDHYLSYQGAVGKVKKGHPESIMEAEEHASQIDPFPTAVYKVNRRKALRKEALARKKEMKKRNKKERRKGKQPKRKKV